MSGADLAPHRIDAGGLLRRTWQHGTPNLGRLRSENPGGSILGTGSAHHREKEQDCRERGRQHGYPGLECSHGRRQPLLARDPGPHNSPAASSKGCAPGRSTGPLRPWLRSRVGPPCALPTAREAAAHPGDK
jgi:hypothetical protein